jgi:hypothetical protein
MLLPGLEVPVALPVPEACDTAICPLTVSSGATNRRSVLTAHSTIKFFYVRVQNSSICLAYPIVF